MRLNKMMAAVGWSDRDCDGIPDHLDPDDDNDGYFDKKQVRLTNESDLHPPLRF